jgi:hypothetical protein
LISENRGKNKIKVVLVIKFMFYVVYNLDCIAGILQLPPTDQCHLHIVAPAWALRWSGPAVGGNGVGR